MSSLLAEAGHRSAPGIGLAAMRLRLIGHMEAWTLGSESVMPPGRKTRALLAIIALSPRPVPRTRLAELLWSRSAEEQARASLRQELHRLLDALAPAGAGLLAVNRGTLSLTPGLVWVDAHEMLHADGSSPAALALMEGELLEGLDGLDPAFDVWLAAERERLRDRVRQVAEAVLRGGPSPDVAIMVSKQLLAADRAHEGAWRALMRAHSARGERGLAMQAYDRCRAVLAELLDAAPSAETDALLADVRGPSSPAAAALHPHASLGSHMPGQALPGSRARPRIGILPLSRAGGNEAEALAAGLSAEISAALLRFRWIAVASSSAIAQSVVGGRDDEALRQAFGLDFLLDGLVQAAGPHVRITLRLVDLRGGGEVVWARRFDRTHPDLLILQSDIAAEAAAQLDPELMLVEARRAAQLAPAGGSAATLLLRALPGMVRLERLSFARSGDLMRRALAMEPDHAPAHFWYASWLGLKVSQGWSGDAAGDRADAMDYAARATLLDPTDARAFTIAGHLQAFLNRGLTEASALHALALALNPNLPMAWAFSGLACALAGDCTEAERRLSRYKQLSPMDPAAFMLDVGFCVAALVRRDPAAAVLAGRAAAAMHPGYSTACKPYLAALGHLGLQDEAAVVRRRLLAIEPRFTVVAFLASSPLAREADQDYFAAGLRSAGIAEAPPQAGSQSRIASG